VLGGGTGLGSVLRALRESHYELTVIVATAEDATQGTRPTNVSDPAVAELLESLEALTDDEQALARAIRRPLAIDRLGRHPLGNFVIQTLATGFGDLGEASAWLGEQLGISGWVLPATIEPVKFKIDAARADAQTGQGLARLRLTFLPDRPRVSTTVIGAIERAHLALLAPGSLFSRVLAACAIPDIAAALADTPARVVWICNREPATGETANDQLAVLQRHSVRVDAALYDPAAALRLSPAQLTNQGVELIARNLGDPVSRMHDRELLRAALTELAAGAPTSTPDVQRSD
jgi:uncharacterized cofD-like protein